MMCEAALSPCGVVHSFSGDAERAASRTRAANALAPPDAANGPSSAHAATFSEVANRLKSARSSGGVSDANAGGGGGGESLDAGGL